MKHEKVGAEWKAMHVERADSIRAVQISPLMGNLQFPLDTAGLATLLKDITLLRFQTHC